MRRAIMTKPHAYLSQITEQPPTEHWPSSPGGEGSSWQHRDCAAAAAAAQHGWSERDWRKQPLNELRSHSLTATLPHTMGSALKHVKAMMSRTLRKKRHPRFDRQKDRRWSNIWEKWMKWKDGMSQWCAVSQEIFFYIHGVKIQKKKSHTREDTRDRGTAHIDNSLHLCIYAVTLFIFYYSGVGTIFYRYHLKSWGF